MSSVACKIAADLWVKYAGAATFEEGQHPLFCDGYHMPSVWGAPNEYWDDKSLAWLRSSIDEDLTETFENFGHCLPNSADDESSFSSFEESARAALRRAFSTRSNGQVSQEVAAGSIPIVVAIPGSANADVRTGLVLTLRAGLHRVEGEGITHRPHDRFAFFPIDDEWWSGFDRALSASDLFSTAAGWEVLWTVDVRPLWTHLGSVHLIRAARLQHDSASAAFAVLVRHLLLKAGLVAKGSGASGLDRLHDDDLQRVCISAVVSEGGTLAGVANDTVSVKLGQWTVARDDGTTSWFVTASSQKGLDSETSTQGRVKRLCADSVDDLWSQLVKTIGSQRYGPLLEAVRPPAEMLFARPALASAISKVSQGNRVVLLHTPDGWGATSFLRWWSSEDCEASLRPAAGGALGAATDVDPWQLLLDLEGRTRRALDLPWTDAKNDIDSLNYSGNDGDQTAHFGKFLKDIGKRCQTTGQQRPRVVLYLDDVERLRRRDGSLHPALQLTLPDCMTLVLVSHRGQVGGIQTESLDVESPDVRVESDALVRRVIDETKRTFQKRHQPENAAQLGAAAELIVAKAEGHISYALKLCVECLRPGAEIDTLLRSLPVFDNLLALPFAHLWHESGQHHERAGRLTAAALVATLQDDSSLNEERLAWLVFGERITSRALPTPPADCLHALPAFRLGGRMDCVRWLAASREARGQGVRAEALAADEVPLATAPRQRKLALAALAESERRSQPAAVGDVTAVANRIASAVADAAALDPVSRQLHATLAALCQSVLQDLRPHPQQPPEVVRYSARWAAWHRLHSVLPDADAAGTGTASAAVLHELLDAAALQRAINLDGHDSLRAWLLTLTRAQTMLPSARRLLRAAVRALQHWEGALLRGELGVAECLAAQLGGWAPAAPLSGLWQAAPSSGETLRWPVPGAPLCEEQVLEGMHAPAFASSMSQADRCWLAAINAQGHPVLYQLGGAAPEVELVARWECMPASLVACAETQHGVLVAAVQEGDQSPRLQILQWHQKTAVPRDAVKLPVPFPPPPIQALRIVATDEPVPRLVLYFSTDHAAWLGVVGLEKLEKVEWQQIPKFRPSGGVLLEMHRTVVEETAHGHEARLFAGDISGQASPRLAAFTLRLEPQAAALRRWQRDPASPVGVLYAVMRRDAVGLLLSGETGFADCALNVSGPTLGAKRWQEETRAIAVAPHGNAVTLGGGRVRIHAAMSNAARSPAMLPLSEGIPEAMAGDPHGQWVAIGLKPPGGSASDSNALGSIRLLGREFWDAWNPDQAPAAPRLVAAHPGGTWIATVRDDATIEVWSADGLTPIPVSDSGIRVSVIAWGADDPSPEFYIGRIDGSAERYGSGSPMQANWTRRWQNTVLALAPCGPSLFIAHGQGDRAGREPASFKVRPDDEHELVLGPEDLPRFAAVTASGTTVFGCDHERALHVAAGGGEFSKLDIALDSLAAKVAVAHGGSSEAWAFVLTTSREFIALHLTGLQGTPVVGYIARHTLPLGGDVEAMLVKPLLSDNGDPECWIWNVMGLVAWRCAGPGQRAWTVCPLPGSAPPIVDVARDGSGHLVATVLGAAGLARHQLRL